MLFWHKKPRRPYLENETSHRTSAGVKTTGFFRAFQIFRRNGFFGFLYFCISGFLGFYLDFWPYLRNEKSYCRSAGVTTTRIVWAFQIFRRNWTFGFLGFWISVFFGFLAIFREQKELPEIHGCQNDRIFEGFSDFQKKLNFLISVFLYFLGIFGYISGTKRATGDPQVSKWPDFLGLFGFPKK